jgi:hypothetical protein
MTFCAYCDNPDELPLCDQTRATTVPKGARYGSGLEVVTINNHLNRPPCTRPVPHDQPHIYCYREVHDAIRWDGAW